MITPFYNDQGFIIDSNNLRFLQHKFGLTEDEVNRRKKWIDMGYFKLHYCVLFSSVAQTYKSILHLTKLLDTITNTPRHLMTRTEYCSSAQRAIESCLLSCKAGMFTREVDENRFNKLLNRVQEMVTNLDHI